MPTKTTRTLIWIPIIHTQVDQGSLSESIRELHIRRLGTERWEQHVRAVEDLWRCIQEDVQSLNLCYTQVRLYQDGLPQCGHEANIVRELAEAGSQNHRLVLNLMQQGATLMGTESTELLLEEYHLARQVLVALESKQPDAAKRRQQKLSASLLERRDCYIAARVRETLLAGETGILFLGLLHSIERRLPPDIRVRKMTPRQNVQPGSTTRK